MWLIRLWCMVLLGVLGVVGAEIAVAENFEMISPQYEHVENIDCTLSINGGIAKCNGQGSSCQRNTKTQIRLALQKRIIGGTKWGEVCYWTASANGLATAMFSKEKAVSSGNDYRLQLKCTISDAEGVILESVTKYSSIKRVN